MVRRGSLALVMLVVAGLLAACGGTTGSGSGAIGPVPDDGYAYSPPPKAVEAVSPPDEPVAAPSAAAYAVNPSLRMTGYETVHRRGILGKGVTVAVVDTGVAPHEQLGARLLDGIDVHAPSTLGRRDVEGHGTHVAGLVAAAGQGRGPVGLAPAASILPVRIFGDDGYASAEHLWQGVQATAGRDVRIYNLSLGGRFDHPDLRRTLDWIRDRDRLAVVAAGNFGWSAPGWPAAHAADYQGEVLAVGAVDGDGRLAVSSNAAGATKDRYLVAPGADIVSLAPDGGTAVMSGTSMAAAVVSGVGALVWGHWPYLKAREVGDILLQTATDLGVPGVDEVYGHGLVNAERALQPVGSLRTQTGGGQAVVAGQPLAVLPVGVRVETAGQRVAYFDRYRRDFYLPVEVTLASTGRAAVGVQRLLEESRDRAAGEVRRAFGDGMTFRGLPVQGVAGRGPHFELTFSSGLRVFEGRRYLSGHLERWLPFSYDVAHARGLGWAWGGQSGWQVEFGQTRARDRHALAYTSMGLERALPDAWRAGVHLSGVTGVERSALALQGSLTWQAPGVGDLAMQLNLQREGARGLARQTLDAATLTLAWEAKDRLMVGDRMGLRMTTMLGSGRGDLRMRVATGVDAEGEPVVTELRLPLFQARAMRLQADYVVPIDRKRSWMLTSQLDIQQATQRHGAIVWYYRQQF